MSMTLERIFLTLFLILGLTVFNITRADELDFNNLTQEEQELTSNCPIKGDVSLRLEGTTRNGELLGWIDNAYVSWIVTMGNIQGYYNGNFMTLRLEQINYNELSLMGWIGSYHVNWRTFGGYFNERIQCR